MITILISISLADYRVGSNITMSELYLFRSFPTYNPTLENWSPHFAIYGDMGNANAQSLPRLQRYTFQHNKLTKQS